MKRLLTLIAFAAGAVVAFKLISGDPRLVGRVAPAANRLWRRVLFSIEEGVRASRSSVDEGRSAPSASRAS